VIGESRTSVHSLPYCGIVEASASGRRDVTFMASQGQSGPGSETQRVLMHTKIPVIVKR
jgi:hypothetical protein